MRRKLVTTILGAVAAAVLAGAAAGQQAGEPVLTVEEARIDLGDIKAGSDAVATFVFHNSGTTPVRILRAKPS